MKTIPQLQALLDRVESKYGRAVNTTSAFEALSVDIERQIGEVLSASSLKRFWGYVTVNTAPRVASLDILARYIGYRDFDSFCKKLRQEDDTSAFFMAESVSVADLQTGCRVQIGWAPDRVVTLLYKGNYLFEVVESFNTKLLVGDQFELSDIILGCPLFIARIYRDGNYTPPYVAGAKEGLNLLKTLPTES